MSSQPIFNGSSISSGSPLNSPLASPLYSPYNSPGDLPWDQLQTQFTHQMSLQPPSVQSSKSGGGSVTGSSSGGSSNTFVHKLFNMVVDKQYQHLIAWTYSGISFIVCNITEFSRDVLPKHFKHNNFSSFVRQLNMYGFHKVNKSPRGHRTLAENQIWEFSHSKFIRGRSDLLDEIKRKTLETDVIRRDNSGDLSSHMSVLQINQSDMMQQLSNLQDNLQEVMSELSETRKKQDTQQQMINKLINYLTKQHGASQLLAELNVDTYSIKPDPERPPPIFITSPDVTGSNSQLQNMYLLNGQEHMINSSSLTLSHSSQSYQQQQQEHYQHHQQHQHQIQQHQQEHHQFSNQAHALQSSSPSLPTRPAAPLTVQTQNLQQPRLNVSISTPENPQPISPLSVYHSALNTPLSPSTSYNAFASDEDVKSIYSSQNAHSPIALGPVSSEHDYQQHHSQPQHGNQLQQLSLPPSQAMASNMDVQMGFSFGFQNT